MYLYIHIHIYIIYTHTYICTYIHILYIHIHIYRYRYIHIHIIYHILIINFTFLIRKLSNCNTICFHLLLHLCYLQANSWIYSLYFFFLWRLKTCLALYCSCLDSWQPIKIKSYKLYILTPWFQSATKVPFLLSKSRAFLKHFEMDT